MRSVSESLPPREGWLAIGVGIATAGLAVLAVTAAFLALRTLEQAAPERGPRVAQGVQSVIEKLRMQAQLEAYRLRQGANARTPRTVSEHVVWQQLERQGAQWVAQGPAQSSGGEPSVRMTALPEEFARSIVGKRAFVWPSSGPQMFAACEEIGPQRMVCAVVSADRALLLGYGALGRDLQLGTVNKTEVLATTSAHTDAPRAEATSRAFSADGLELKLSMQETSHATSALWGQAEPTSGWVAAATSAAAGVALAAFLLVRRAGHLRDRRMREALETTETLGRERERAALRTVANAAGLVVWRLFDDEQLEVLGSAYEGLGVCEETKPLAGAWSAMGDCGELRIALRHALRRRDHWTRIQTQHVDGETFTYQMQCVPVRDSEGRFVAMVGTMSDISKALIERRRMTRYELSNALQTKYLEAFARAISGPAAQVFAALDQAHNDPSLSALPALRSAVSLGSGEAARLSGLVRGTVRLLQLLKANVQAGVRPMRVDALVQKTASNVFKREGAPRGHALTIVGSVERKVLTHQQSLTWILTIVLTNACRYSGAGATVVVAVAATPEALHVTIQDTGPGMEDDELARLGEPYFRGTAAVNVPGVGLGIPTCLELVARIGARISFARADAGPGPGSAEDAAEGVKPGQGGLLVTLQLPWAA